MSLNDTVESKVYLAWMMNPYDWENNYVMMADGYQGVVDCLLDSLFEDAGVLSMLLPGDCAKGVPLSFEAVFSQFHHAKTIRIAPLPLVARCVFVS